MLLTKVCNTCFTEQPETAFFFKDKAHTRRHNMCRLCHNKKSMTRYYQNRERILEENRKHYHKMKHDLAWHENRYLVKRAWKYKLPLEEVRQIWQAQSCTICGETTPAGEKKWWFLIFDHSHQTGKFRGLLCRQCNWILGHAKDNPAILRKAADYLEATQVS